MRVAGFVAYMNINADIMVVGNMKLRVHLEDTHVVVQ
jgi:hypothetical protein